MFDFKDIVSSILLEQDETLKTLEQLFAKHNQLFGTTTSIDEALQELFPIIQKVNVSESDALNNVSKIRILDVLQQLYDLIPPKKPGTWNEFKAKIQGTDSVQARINEIYNKVKSLTSEKRTEWPVESGEVKKAWEMARAAGNKLAATALTTYNNESVLDAVQAIINKRIDFFTRVGKLKSPTKPFTNLITDIFRQPELYLSGQKKYTSDFEAVDQLYITDIIKVALAGKEFYASEIAKLQMQQLQLDTSSYNGFLEYVNFLLSENIDQRRRVLKNVAQTRQGTQASGYKGFNDTSQAQQFDQKLFNKLYDKALNDSANRVNFLAGKAVAYPMVDKEGNEIISSPSPTNPEEYTVGKIQKMTTTQSINLTRALQSIAQYTRKGAGTGERIAGLKTVAQGIEGLTGIGDAYGRVG